MKKEIQDFITEKCYFLDLSDVFQHKEKFYCLSQKNYKLQHQKIEKYEKSIYNKRHEKWKNTELEIKHLKFYLQYFKNNPLKKFSWKNRRPRKIYACMQIYLNFKKSIPQCIAYDQSLMMKNIKRFPSFKQLILYQAKRLLKGDSTYQKLVKEIQQNDNLIQQDRVLMQQELRVFKLVDIKLQKMSSRVNKIDLNFQ